MILFHSTAIEARSYRWPLMQTVLIGILSISTVQAYYFGDVLTNQSPDAFQHGSGWQPDWRGTSYVGRCTTTQRNVNDAQQNVQGIGIINGAPVPGSTHPSGMRHGPSESGHNVEALVFYKSDTCNSIGTDQFFVVKFQQNVRSADGRTLVPYRGVSSVDLGMLRGVDLTAYRSYQEVDFRSTDWTWVIMASVPETQGEVVVFQRDNSGIFGETSRLPIQTPDRATASSLAQSLANNMPGPVIANLRVALRNIADLRHRARLVGTGGTGGPSGGGGGNNFGSLLSQIPPPKNTGPGTTGRAGTVQQLQIPGPGLVLSFGQAVGNVGANPSTLATGGNGDNPSSTTSDVREVVNPSSMGSGGVPQSQNQYSGPNAFNVQRGTTNSNSGQRQPLTLHQLREMGYGQRRPSNQGNSREERISDPTSQRAGGTGTTSINSNRQAPFFEMMQPQFMSGGNMQTQPVYQSILPQSSRNTMPEGTQGFLSQNAQNLLSQNPQNPASQIPQNSQSVRAGNIQNPGSQSSQNIAQRPQNEVQNRELPQQDRSDNQGQPFVFTSSNIPSSGPLGSLSRFYGDLPRFQVTNPTGIRPLDVDAAERDNQPTIGRLGPPTSPTLQRNPINLEYIHDEHTELNRLNTFFDNRARMVVPFPHTDRGLQDQVFNPPRQRNTNFQIPLEPEKRPNPYQGWLNEGEMEERTHFPSLYDSNPFTMEMELETVSNAREGLEENLASTLENFGSLPDPRRSRYAELYDDWRRTGNPILGNLHTLPINEIDPNWAIIDRTYEEIRRDIRGDWHGYYQGNRAELTENYQQAQASVKNDYNRVERQRTKILKDIEDLETKAKKKKNSWERRAGYESEAEKLGKIVRQLDRQLADLQYQWERNEFNGRLWEISYGRQLADLEARYRVWKDLAIRNIERETARLGSIERDPRFGTLE